MHCTFSAKRPTKFKAVLLDGKKIIQKLRRLTLRNKEKVSDIACYKMRKNKFEEVK